MPTPESILKKYWGYDQFRYLQREIIESVLAHQDTIALLPTGGGKSLCYQLPALYMEGICIVVSPLIALMKDQVDNLKKRGVKATAIYTGLTHREIDIILDNCIYGQTKLLYVAPERLKTELFIERAKMMNINLLAVDEAHCISQWGYDFRPSYLQIADFRNTLPKSIPTLALTATATGRVIDDMVDKLVLPTPKIYKGSFARSNLSLAVRTVEHKEEKLLQALNNVPGSALVYARLRKTTHEIANLLLQHDIRADYYHGGLSHDLRKKKQELWIRNKTQVMVATNAFGMGIDKPDVRLVVHYDMPDNLEAYFQEAGRAGRDGQRAYAVIIFHPGDSPLLKHLFENAFPSIAFLKRVYQALANYYKLAVGSNALSFYDFDITDFCNNFNFHVQEVYHALNKLEEEGLISLNESFYHPSKVSFNLDKTELYKFQIANARMDPLIKTLLRLHGGEIIGNFASISEHQIARVMNISTYKIKKMLDHMNTLKVITYDKLRDKPQLIFLTQRYDAASLPINSQRLAQRRSIAEDKLTAVLKYVEDKTACRMNFILRYFGEHTFEDCGHCDHCLEKKRKTNRSDIERIHEILHYEIKKSPVFPDELIRMFADSELQMVEQIMKEMLDTNQVVYDDEGRLTWWAQ